MSKKAIVLCSGGIDSTTVMAIARSEGYTLYALTIDYGQRHRIELEASRKVASAFKVKQHLIITTDFTPIGGSALTGVVQATVQPFTLPFLDLAITIQAGLG